MIAYKGSFLKKTGELREMFFVKAEDINRVNSEFIASKIKGNKSNNRAEGALLVWDLENDQFRTFNTNTQIGELLAYQVDDSLFE